MILNKEATLSEQSENLVPRCEEPVVTRCGVKGVQHMVAGSKRLSPHGGELGTVDGRVIGARLEFHQHELASSDVDFHNPGEMKRRLLRIGIDVGHNTTIANGKETVDRFGRTVAGVVGYLFIAVALRGQILLSELFASVGVAAVYQAAVSKWNQTNKGKKHSP